MTGKQDNLTIYGFNDICKYQEYEIFYGARPPMGPDDLFKIFAKEKDWSFSRSDYQAYLATGKEYKCAGYISETKFMTFAMRADNKNPEIRNVGAYIFERQNWNKLVSMTASFKTNAEKALNCKIWLVDRNLDAVQNLAEEFKLNHNDTVRHYGDLFLELKKYALNTPCHLSNTLQSLPLQLPHAA
jgi:hypothetical protein